jgi:hypothetical protein
METCSPRNLSTGPAAGVLALLARRIVQDKLFRAPLESDREA